MQRAWSCLVRVTALRRSHWTRRSKELNVVDMYAADNGAGYVVQTTASGYGGPITVMTGVRSDGTVEKSPGHVLQ